MLIDRKHWGWAIFSAVVVASATGWYAYYVCRGEAALNGPSGSSFTGLTFGIAGSVFFIFAGLLGARRRMRAWRFGSAQFWLRGHLWLGALSVPLIWFHAGFRHGGTLTSVLMWLFYLTVASGIVGAILQHVLPRRLTVLVPAESTYEQIPHLLRHLAADADHLVSCYCGPLTGEDAATWKAQAEEVITANRDRYLIDADRASMLRQAIATAPAPGSVPFKEFYVNEIQPVMRERSPRSPLLKPGRAEVRFTQQRLLLPEHLHSPLADLRQLWERRRALLLQRRIQRWMDGWLFVHVPVSYAVMTLFVIHVIYALRYSL